MLIHGACQCRGIQFEIEGPTRFCAHCHCKMCRRSVGAPLVTWSGVLAEALRVTAGAELLTRYASSPEAARSFCSRCGTSLFFESSRWPGEIHVTTECFDDPPEPGPKAHVYFSDKAPWFEVGDSLPKFGGATGMERLDESPGRDD